MQLVISLVNNLYHKYCSVKHITVVHAFLEWTMWPKSIAINYIYAEIEHKNFSLWRPMVPCYGNCEISNLLMYENHASFSLQEFYVYSLMKKTKENAEQIFWFSSIC